MGNWFSNSAATVLEPGCITPYAREFEFNLDLPIDTCSTSLAPIILYPTLGDGAFVPININSMRKGWFERGAKGRR
jgi:hypothetical protein